MQVDGVPAARLTAGDVVVIAPGTPQRVTNTGVEDFVFYALCTPRFRPNTYRAVRSDVV